MWLAFMLHHFVIQVSSFQSSIPEWQCSLLLPFSCCSGLAAQRCWSKELGNKSATITYKHFVGCFDRKQRWSNAAYAARTWGNTIHNYTILHNTLRGTFSASKVLSSNSAHSPGQPVRRIILGAKFARKRKHENTWKNPGHYLSWKV